MQLAGAHVGRQRDAPHNGRMNVHNVIANIEGDFLVIRVRVDAATIKFSPISKSGKSKLLASSGGFLPVADVPGMALSLNVSIK